MVADALTGNISREATIPFGNIFAEAMRGPALPTGEGMLHGQRLGPRRVVSQAVALAIFTRPS